MTKYTVLTGATGLLGSFLLRDLLIKDVPVVALVRSSRLETATERIEGILQRFERQLGRPLPRPIVMECNLREPELGLTNEEKSWLSRHADAMLHNAASLSFVETDAGEPYKSNVDGTRNTLELCRTIGVRKFFHVSTAYVCGNRRERIMESDFSDASGFGNDYEKSKFAAEKMVREADWLGSVTVFRPAIIVGDSVTGYTSTYHGFYAPMKILVPLIEPENAKFEGVEAFGEILGMNPDDLKNFVPVDWIARVMTSIVVNSRLHGETYHLTGGNRVSIGDLSRLIVEGIRRYKKPGESKIAPMELARLLPLFHDQMEVYQAYWRDDPEFDMTNTLRAVPQFPPVPMTDEQLLIFVRFAIESKFGWPKPKPTRIEFPVASALEGPNASFAERNDENAFGLRVSGVGGGDWTIARDGATRGLPLDAPLMTMNSRTFRAFYADRDVAVLESKSSWESGSETERQSAIAALRGLVEKNA
ncbi:MAG: SDR family oxidoreductase, partial [Thermoguttaceae bacterium]|nr:SDR family oxidoreductase [Thermoguttaceae bacterium]